LRLARRQIARYGWNNVSLHKGDASQLREGDGFDAAICTFAIEIIPPYTATIDSMIDLTKKNGRIGFIGFDYSNRPFLKKFNQVWILSCTFEGGITLDRNVLGYLEETLRKVFYREVLGGYYYIAVFEKE